jgi:hypothetical protein
MEKISAGSAEVDPVLVEAWVAGWALARNIAPPVPFKGGLRVDTGTPEERVRYVWFGPDAGKISQLAAAETRPGAFIKVCAEANQVAPFLPPLWKLHGPQHVMTAGMELAIEVAVELYQPLPAGYFIEKKIAGPVCHAAIQNHARRIIASGRLVLVGCYGIVDEINTEPGHRRRGLATHIVTALMQMGSTLGAKTGVLVATADGYGLYSKIGWQVHAPYTSAYNI